MTIQLIKPFEARLTAGGPGIQGRRGVLYQTVDETPARLYVWDGEKHVPLPVLGPDGSLNNGGEAYALATAETLVTWNDDATALLAPDGIALFAAPRTVVVAAGTPTPDIETAISRASAMSPAYDAPVQIVLPPGTYALAASTMWPSWVSLRGAGQKLTRIIATNTNNLRIGTGGTFEDFTVEGTATGATVGLLRHSGAYVRDCIVRNVDVWHESTSGQALYFGDYVHSMRWENVKIWTKSIAAKMRGMQWMYGCTFGIAGDATGTPYVALDVVGAGYLQLHNCMIGNGYNYTTRTGWPDGMTITNDSTAPAYGVRIASGTPGTPRVNMFNCYSFINHLTRAANDVNCVLAEAAGYVRLYGGIYQAEANNFTSPTLVQSGSAVIEQYAARFSRQSGEIRGYAGYAGLQAKTASFTVDEDGPDGVILCDASSGPITVTLSNPSVAPSARRGAVRRVKKIDASANAVTLSCAAGIDGATTLVLGSQWATAKVVLGETQWYVMP